MRLNRLGQAIGRGHRDGVVLPSMPGYAGNEYGPVSDTGVIAQMCGTTECAVAQLKAGGTWAIQTADAAGNPHGANWLRGAQARWFAFYQGVGYCNTSGPYPDFAPADADQDTGMLALTRYSTGRNIILLALDGTQRTISTGPIGTDAVAFRNIRYRSNWLLYQEQGRGWTLTDPAGHDVVIEPRTEGVDHAVPVPVDDEGTCLLLERANGRLTLRYPDSIFGWLVHEDQSSTGLVAPDAMLWTSGVRVVWSNDQSETAGVFAKRDVALNQADLIDLNAEALPPLESVPLLNRPFGLACYTFNNAETLGNLSLPIRPAAGTLGEGPFIATVDDEDWVPDDQLWAVYSGAVNSEADLKAARKVGNERKRGLTVYQDRYPMTTEVKGLAESRDILTPQVYRNPGETSEHYARRLTAEYTACTPFGECWPTVNIHRRYGPTGPTLSVRDVVDGFVTATQLAGIQGWPGMVLFRVGTMDMPAEVVPYIERFLSGITATPDARIIHQPPPEVSMPYAILKKQTPGDPVVSIVKLTEEQKDGKLFLNLPDGKKLSMQSDGTIGDRPHDTYGPWEEFIKTGKGYVAAAHGEKYGIVTL